MADVKQQLADIVAKIAADEQQAEQQALAYKDATKQKMDADAALIAALKQQIAAGGVPTTDVQAAIDTLTAISKRAEDALAAAGVSAGALT